MISKNINILSTKKLLLAFLLISNVSAFAQSGMSTSPSRIYFKPEEKNEQSVVVRNPSKDKELEVGISFNDWEYDSLGNNVTYDAGKLATTLDGYLQIASGSSFFTLAPGETRTIRLSLKDIPNDSVPVRTSMMYLTQLNPGEGSNHLGAAILVSVRMGIKIYHTNIANPTLNMEITDFNIEKKDDAPTDIKLSLDNIGNGWLEGKIHYELLNQDTGDKYKLEETEFYSMPGDKRLFTQKLPETMKKGNYSATALVKLNKESVVKVAELTFKN